MTFPVANMVIYGSNGGNYASSGTVYLKSVEDVYGHVVIDNQNVASGLYTELRTLLPGADSILLRNRGRLSTSTSYVMTGGSMSIEANSAFAPAGGLQLTNAILEGNGTLAGNLINGGTVAPGLPPTAPTGTLTVTGTYTEQPSGILRLQVSGTQASQKDVLAVTGAGTLGGVAAFEFLNGFEPAAQDSFTVLTASSLTGQPIGYEGTDSACVHIHPTKMVLRCHHAPQAPETYITLGPTEGSHTNAADIPLGWTGRDNATPVASLTYARRLDAGAWTAFLPDTTYSYSSLAEGLHQFQVKARDADLMEDLTPATRSFMMDRTAPVTTITAGPAQNQWTGPSVGFTWQATDVYTPSVSLSYSFRLDGGEWSEYAHVTNTAYSGLAHGEHTFEVRARDLAGNEETPPLSRVFRVDLENPDTQITSGPAEGDTLAVDATAVGWTGSDGQTPTESLQYSWRLDAGSWSSYATATQANLTALADGPRRFQVRARDQVGNVDPTPDTLRFVVDADGPVVSITSGPAAGQHIPQAGTTYAWTALDVITPRAELEFAWRLNGAPSAWSADTSTVLAGLVEGQHIFDALSRDERGRAGTSTRQFTVDLTDPDTEILTGPADSSWVTTSSVTFTWRGSDNISLPNQLAFSWRVDDGTWSSFSASMATTLQNLPGGDHLFQVKARDLSGREDPFAATRFFHVGPTDLVVTELTVPSEGSFDEPIVLTWTVTNQGAGPAAGTWKDRVWLSTDDQPGGDETLADFTRPQELLSGQSYTQTQAVSIAEHAPGDYWIIVQTDVLAQITELQGETNNSRVASQAVQLSIPPHPDLRVTAAAGPTEAWSGQGMEAIWRVENLGTAAASGGWRDRVYLSADSLAGDDTLLGTFNYTEGLNPGGGYDHVHPVSVPAGIEGPHWIVVLTDVEDRVAEYGEETNNTLIGTQRVQIHALQYPDLEVTSITGPVSAVAGATVEVLWEVRNVGPEPTDAPIWYERVYLSPQPEIVAGATFTLATVSSRGYLPPASSYQNSAEVVLPDDIAGAYYVLVQADVNNQLYEGGGEGNNLSAGAEPIVVELMNPFLRVTSVMTQLYGWSGELVDMTWQVKNVGEVTFTSTHWDDGVVFSSDAVLDAGDPTLATGIYHESPIAPGEIDTMTASVRLPQGVSGRAWLFVVPNVHQVDNVHGLAGADSISITEAPPPDLEVTALSSSADSVATGAPLSVTWTVTNPALSITTVPSWRDALYLSADSVYSAGSDRQLGYWTIEEYLSPDDFYTRTRSVNMPADLWGSYYLILRTDVLGQVDEGEWEGNNARAYGPVEIYLTPVNLKIASVTPPGEAWSGQAASFSYTATNTGTGPAPATTWVDRAYLSADSILTIGTDALVASRSHTGPLAPGGSYQDAFSVTLPNGTEGTWYLFLLADGGNAVYEYGGEGDNTLRTPFTIQLTPPSDLLVDQVLPLAAAWSGDSLSVRWRVRNAGVGSTNAASWRDALHYSADSLYQSGTDPQMISRTHTGALAPDGSYEVEARFLVPNGESGDRWLLLRTDADNAVYEHQAEGNNLGRGTFAVQLTPPPDLQVTEILPLNAAWSGDTLEVRWTVRNLGTGGTRSTSWRDELYTSVDSVLSPGTDPLVRSYTRSGALAPDSSYAVTATYVIPVGEQGVRYFFARTDANNQVYEHQSESNNTSRAAVTVQLTAPPDLRVTAAAQRTEAWDNQALRVAWTVTNVGSGGSVVSNWSDAICLSADSLYQSGQDVPATTRAHSGVLAPGASYADSAEIVLPRGISGPWYVLVRADVQAQVYEHGLDGNNLRPVPVQVQLHPYPDLQVTYLQGPAEGTSGSPAILQWTVTNTGVGPTGGANWVDRVYWSTDASYQAGTDPLLASFAHSGTLAPGEAYLDSRAVDLPAGQSGLRYFILQADGQDVVYEYTAEGNNLRVTAIQVNAPSQPLPDLVADDLQIGSKSFAGDKASAGVQWTVRNAGLEAPPQSQSYWTDSFYLSGDGTLDSGDLLLASHNWTGGLAPGDTYTKSATLTFPHGLSGDYQVFLKTDAADRVAEADAANNVRSSPTTIALVLADLVVPEVNAPVAGLSGQPIRVGWRVQNAGSGTTEGTGWYDCIYLSRDGVVDDTDHLLLSRRHSGALEAGAAYVDSADAPVPLGVSGSFYVIVRTDRNNEIYEHQAEANNFTRDLDAVVITLPAPANLMVASVTVPLAGEAGRPIEVSWEVSNIGDNPAEGAWVDAVYMSADSLWDLADVHLGDIEHTGGLAPNKSYRGSYLGTTTTSLPGLTSGTYKAVVRTDLRNNVLEADETNNTAASADVSVAVTELVPGVTYPAHTEVGKEQYFHVSIGAQSDVRVTVQAAGAYDDLQLYVGYGSMPDRIVNDGTFDVAPSRVKILPGGDGQGVYFMVRCDFALSTVDYTILVEDLQFGFASVAPAEAGDAGFATLSLSGGQLDDLVEVRLQPDSGPGVSAWERRAESSAALAASFDLRDAAPGLYDVVGWTADGDTTRLVNGFRVVSGLGSMVVLTIDGMTSLRVDTESEYVITLRNQGDADAFDVTSSAILAAGTRYRLVSGDSTMAEGISDGTPLLFTTREVGIGRTAQYSLRVRSSSDITMDIVAIDVAPERVDLPGVDAVVFEPLRSAVTAFTTELAARGFAASPDLVFGEAVRCWLLESSAVSTAYSLVRLERSLRSAAPAAYAPVPDEIALAAAVSAAQADFSAFADAARGGIFPRANLYVRIVRPTDPNAKVGPSGLEDGFVTVDEILPYTVYFENVPSATAPALEVRIYDPMDPDLDLRRFRLGELAFGGTVIPVPEDVSYWHTFVPLPSGMVLEIDAGIDINTETAHWYFDTIDPETGLPPIDPNLGFLPPNDSTGVGQGHVSFSLQAEPESAPGTELTNQAMIVFDLNDPILTNTVKSTMRASWPDLATSELRIESSQVPPLEGEPVALTAVIVNGRTVAADSVGVLFEEGDPAEGGAGIGDTLWIETLPGFAEADRGCVWTPRGFYGDREVRVIVDPSGRIDEEDEENNVWAAILPVAPRSYQVPVREGVNLIALPLAPTGGQTASGLAALTGAEMVIRLDSTGVFVPWLADDPESEDFPLETSSGYVAVAAQADTTEFIGATPDGAVRVRAGYNLVSLPVDPDTIPNARDFAQRLGAKAVIRWAPDLDKFVSFIPAFHPDDGFPLRGGEAYIVLCEGDTVAAFSGTGWHGVQAPLQRAAPLPPIVKSGDETTGSVVVAVTGHLRQRVRGGATELTVPLVAEIENERTGARAAVPVRAGNGHFAVAFLDFSGGEAGQVGDLLEIRFRRADGSLVPDVVRHVLDDRDVAGRHVRIEGAVLALPPAQTLFERVAPNPLRQAALIRYQLAREERVALHLFSVDGRRVQTLVDGVQPAGYYDVAWNLEVEGGRISSGIYFVRFNAGSYRETQKLVVVR